MTNTSPAPASVPTRRAPSLETAAMTKRFGTFTALDAASIKVEAGSFHALLGENGAGKSTLVKCITGFYTPDEGQVILDNREAVITSPRDARALGIGMVYQHFTLVPCMTAAENLVIARADVPAIINWKRERQNLADFMDRMPFRIRLDARVADLSAGEKQKLEILKLLYLEQNFMILDEPTSVLTPGEADEILGMLGEMAARKEITVLMISHKFREVKAFCDSFTVLRRGAVTGTGDAQAVTVAEMSRMMIGDAYVRSAEAREARAPGAPVLSVENLQVLDAEERPVVDDVSFSVCAGEIIGVAGVSGNGQSALVEALSGQRPITGGKLAMHGKPFAPKRADLDRFKVFGLPEEPLKNAAVARMSVAENMAFRTFDKRPIKGFAGLVSRKQMITRAEALINRYRVKTTSPDAPIGDLSGGNVQRAILARELSGEVDVLIVANPCFGLDFASVAEIRAQIMAQRNRGAAVLLVSEDLDEILELSDRIAVMSEGRIGRIVPAGETDRNMIGQEMAGH